jgi:hypothetical protein
MLEDIDFQRRSRFLLAEWNSLRKESLDAIERRVAIQKWGIAGSTALVGFSVDLALEHQHFITAFWLLVVGTPAFASLIATIWAGEAQRSGRAGEYMVMIEKELNLAAVGDVGRSHHRPTPRPYPLLGWETFLRRGHQMELPYLGVGAGLLASALAGPISGYYVSIGHIVNGQQISVLCGVIAFVYFVGLLWWIDRNVK